MKDLIFRHAAIDALKNERSDWNCDYNVPIDRCIDIIKDLPSAQSDRKEGRWMLKKINEDEYGNAKFAVICSECGVPAYEFSQPYCHRCGAKMRERKEEWKSQ